MKQEGTPPSDTVPDDYSSSKVMQHERSDKAATEELAAENSAIARALSLASGIQRRRRSCPGDFSTVDKSIWSTEKEISTQTVTSEWPSFALQCMDVGEAETVPPRSRSLYSSRRERMREKFCCSIEKWKGRRERGEIAQSTSTFQSVRQRKRWSLPGKGGQLTHNSNGKPPVGAPVSDTPVMSPNTTNNADNEHPTQQYANARSSLSTQHSFDDCVAAIEALLHDSQSQQNTDFDIPKNPKTKANFYVFSRFFAGEDGGSSGGRQGERCDTIDKIGIDDTRGGLSSPAIDDWSSCSSIASSTTTPSVHNDDGILG